MRFSWEPALTITPQDWSIRRGSSLPPKYNNFMLRLINTKWWVQISTFGPALISISGERDDAFRSAGKCYLCKARQEQGQCLLDGAQCVSYSEVLFPSDLTLSTAAAVPFRPIIAVYHFVRRHYHPCNSFGIWRPEEDRVLKESVRMIYDRHIFDH